MTDPPYPSPQGLSMTAKVYGGCKEMLAVRRSAQTEARAAFSISNEARKPRVRGCSYILMVR